MWARLLIPLSVAAILNGQGLKTRKASDEFVGAWNLISYQRKNTAGEITYPMGEKPVGRLTYDALGRMSAQIMRPDRSNFQSAIAMAGAAGEKTTAFDGYIAYY